MRLGTCLLPEGLTLQGAHLKMASFCSAPVAGFYAAVDNGATRSNFVFASAANGGFDGLHCGIEI
jgi:hypothetical protein